MTSSRHDSDLPGSHDDHAHEVVMPLGPIDWIAWGAGILGVALGLVVVVGFALATIGVA
jgi:hypothetical protein